MYKLFLILLFITFVASQGTIFSKEKPGSCPPPLPLQICSQACFFDIHCQGIGKCCPTSCGGYICSRPVTMRPPPQPEKAGKCPATPTGRWVCSPTCSNDSDCTGTRKCCKNRCGALACQKPDVEIVKSIEIPYEPIPDDNPTHINTINVNPNNPFLFNN